MAGESPAAILYDEAGNRVGTSANPLTAVPLCGSSAVSSVASSATDIQILAANSNRKGASVFNDSTQILYLKLGTGAASTSSFSVRMVANAYFEVPFGYTGELRGIWATANGNARVTEFT